MVSVTSRVHPRLVLFSHAAGSGFGILINNLISKAQYLMFYLYFIYTGFSDLKITFCSQFTIFVKMGLLVLHYKSVSQSVSQSSNCCSSMGPK